MASGDKIPSWWQRTLCPYCNLGIVCIMECSYFLLFFHPASRLQYKVFLSFRTFLPSILIGFSILKKHSIIFKICYWNFEVDRSLVFLFAWSTDKWYSIKPNLYVEYIEFLTFYRLFTRMLKMTRVYLQLRFESWPHLAFFLFIEFLLP